MALLGRFIPTFQRVIPRLKGRCISTGNKSSEAVAATKSNQCTPSVAKEDTNWVSYGFNPKDQTEDVAAMHITLFLGVSLAIVGGSWYFMYCPDTRLKNWAQREAFIEIKRREKAGKVLIDPNIVDPSTMKLPKESELENVELII